VDDGVSVDTGRMAAERSHVVGTLLPGRVAGPLFAAYRDRAHELGWTAGPDRFAYASVIGVGETSEEGQRHAYLAADYVCDLRPHQLFSNHLPIRRAIIQLAPTSQC
jgi:hypothetical protein